MIEIAVAEDCCRRVHHTVVAGYSGGLKTLQLHLSNIELLGSTVYDVLLKSNEKYLLLPEAHTEILPISIMPAGKSESSADYSGVTLGSVCGATNSFVAGYGKEIKIFFFLRILSQNR